MATQDFLHGTFQVVVTQNTEYTAKIGERQLMRFQKRLLIGVRISPMKGATAGHAAQAEHVRLSGLAVELDPAFVPIHLRLATELIRLRHKDFMPQQAHGSLPGAHILTNRRFCYLGFRSLTAQSHPYPVRRVSLLSGRLAVSLQNRVYEWDRHRQLRPLAFRNFAVRRHRATQRLPHLSPMYPQFPGHRPDRSGPMFVLLPDLLV